MSGLQKYRQLQKQIKEISQNLDLVPPEMRDRLNQINRRSRMSDLSNVIRDFNASYAIPQPVRTYIRPTHGRVVDVDMDTLQPISTETRPSGPVINKFEGPFTRIQMLRYRQLHPNEVLSIQVSNSEGTIFTIPFEALLNERTEDTTDPNHYGNDIHSIDGFHAASAGVIGSCDTNHQRIVSYGAFKIMTLKARNHNCLVACFAHHIHDKHKHKVISRELQLTEGAKTNSDIKKLANHYSLYARIWIPSDEAVAPISSFGNPEHPIIDILHNNGHFYYIVSGTVYSIVNPGTSAIQSINNQIVFNNSNETIYDNEDNDFSRIVNIIAKTNDNFYIDGPAGSGKSFLASLVYSKLQKIAMTATTGIAAARLGGITIDRLILLNQKHQSKLNCDSVLIDEISMCDAYKMDEIIRFCSKKQLRLILVGDVMQLPPVKQEIGAGWFFQSDYLRALNLRHIVLRKVRRTNNIEFAEMCGRFRVGTHTEADLQFIMSKHNPDAKPDDYGLFIASTNKKVDAHNKHKFEQIKSQEFSYPARIITKDEEINAESQAIQKKKERIINNRSIKLKVGARVMATKNIAHLGISNGLLGVITQCSPEVVHVLFDGFTNETTISYIENEYARAKLIKYSFMPLKLAYALTVHKSQGLTCNTTLLFDCEKIFAPGMFYTAITRVSNPDNLTLTGNLTIEQLREISNKVNKTALSYLNGENVETMSELFLKNEDNDAEAEYYKKNRKCEVLTQNKKSNQEPSECYYFDFETAKVNGFSRIEPYLCTYAIAKHPDIFTPYKSGYHCDIPGYNQSNEGVEGKFAKRTLSEGREVRKANFGEAGLCHPSNETVIARTIKDIMDMMHRFEAEVDRRFNNLIGITGDSASYMKQGRDLRSFSKRTCPRFCAFNGSAFDNYFVAESLINTKVLDDKEYSMNMIMKGSQMISFSVLWKKHYCTVLSCHDLCQVINCSLKDACEQFLPKDSEKKLEFKHEIMDISNNRYENWRDWSAEQWHQERELEIIDFGDPKMPITEDNPGRIVSKKILKYKPSDVIEYGLRDTSVLCSLYRAVDPLIREITELAVFSFMTVGAITWYQMVRHASEIIPKHVSNKKVANLYSCDKIQDDFIREGIYGGRSCPRIIYNTSDKPYIYADISGMYGSIQSKAIFPCGKPSWVPESQINNMLETIREFCKDKTIHDLTFDNLPTFWVGRCEFQENPRSLEPVVALKTKTGTQYTVERRKAVITSLDMAMILVKGGVIHSCSQMITFSDSAAYCAPWVCRCLEGKAKYKGKPLGAFYKLLANAAYGQCLKRDHTRDYKIVSRPEQTRDFLQKYNWNFFITTRGIHDILYGELKDKEINFQTTRPPYTGAFVLAYSRLMVQRITCLANPEENPELQPALGDTDSLLIPLECVNRLMKPDKNGFVWFPEKAQAGQLTDELMDTLLKFKCEVEKNESSKEERIKPEERDDWKKRRESKFKEEMAKYNGKLAICTRFFSPAPKVLACEFSVPSVSERKYYKFRCKGVSVNSMIGDRLMSASILFDFLDEYKKTIELNNESNGLCATLPDGLKKISPSSVKQDDRNQSKTLFTIETNQMIRNILKHRWEGRKYLGNGITVPFGYAP